MWIILALLDVLSTYGHQLSVDCCVHREKNYEGNYSVEEQVKPEHIDLIQHSSKVRILECLVITVMYVWLLLKSANSIVGTVR